MGGRRARRRRLAGPRSGPGPDAAPPRARTRSSGGSWRPAPRRMERWPASRSLGIGVPGCYDPVAGTTRFLVNMPGDWAGPSGRGPPVSATLGIPVALINDARAFGLAELRLGAGRGASSMVGLTLGTGVGGVIAIDGRVVSVTMGRPARSATTRSTRTARRAAAATTAVSRRSPVPTGSPPRAGRTTAEDAVDGGPAPATPGRWPGWRRSAATSASGSATWSTLISPDRVVIGGGIAAAGDLLLDPIRAEMRRRVHMTSLAEVEVVTARARDLGRRHRGRGPRRRDRRRAADRRPTDGP